MLYSKKNGHHPRPPTPQPHSFNLRFDRIRLDLIRLYWIRLDSSSMSYRDGGGARGAAGRGGAVVWRGCGQIRRKKGARQKQTKEKQEKERIYIYYLRSSIEGILSFNMIYSSVQRIIILLYSTAVAFFLLYYIVILFIPLSLSPLRARK